MGKYNFDEWKDKRRRNRALCIECQYNPVEIRNGPRGGWYGGGRGLCVECYERLIRQSGTVIRVERIREEIDGSVILVF
jgi:hypothetical protein